MKDLYAREIRHICANYLTRNQSTGYCKDSKSEIMRAIKKLIKHKWIEVVSIKDRFVFVKPTELLLKMEMNSNL